MEAGVTKNKSYSFNYMLNILFTLFGSDLMDLIHVYPIKLSIFRVISEIICIFMTS